MLCLFILVIVLVCSYYSFCCLCYCLFWLFVVCFSCLLGGNVGLLFIAGVCCLLLCGGFGCIYGLLICWFIWILVGFMVALVFVDLVIVVLFSCYG